PFEALQSLLIEVTPERSVVQCDGVRNDRDEGHSCDPTVSRVAQKHIKMGIWTDLRRGDTALNAAAEKTTRAKLSRPRLKASHSPKRRPSHIDEYGPQGRRVAPPTYLPEHPRQDRTRRNVRPEKRRVQRALARAHAINQIDESNQILIRRFG